MIVYNMYKLKKNRRSIMYGITKTKIPFYNG